MALVVQEEPFICFLSVNAGFEDDFDDLHANKKMVYMPMNGNRSLFATAMVN